MIAAFFAFFKKQHKDAIYGHQESFFCSFPAICLGICDSGLRRRRYGDFSRWGRLRLRSRRKRSRDSHAVLESTDDDWEAVLDVLGRMKLLLAGGDVEVPAAHVVAPLSGPALKEFRQLLATLFPG
jgi:hypothetical protein